MCPALLQVLGSLQGTKATHVPPACGPYPSMETHNKKCTNKHVRYQMVITASGTGQGAGRGIGGVLVSLGGWLVVVHQRPELSEGMNPVGILENVRVKHSECKGPGVRPVNEEQHGGKCGSECG